MERFLRACVMLTAAFAFGAIATAENSEHASYPMFSGLLVTTSAHAQNGGGGGLTCGWCESDLDVIDQWGNWGKGHRFPNGGDGCGWIGNGGGNGGASFSGGMECSRCGGTSECHNMPELGGCHIECGPGGGDELAAAIADLEESISRQDAGGVLRVVNAISGLDFSWSDRAVRAAGPCHDPEASVTFPMSSGLADRVNALLQAQ